MKYELGVTLHSETVEGIVNLLGSVHYTLCTNVDDKALSFGGHPKNEDGEGSYLLKRNDESSKDEEEKKPEEKIMAETKDDSWYAVEALEQMKDGETVVAIPDDQFKYGIGYMTHEGGVKVCVVVRYNRQDDTFNPIDIYPEESWIREFRGKKFTKYHNEYLTIDEAYSELADGRIIDDVEFNKTYFANKIDDPVHGTEEEVVFTFDSCGDLELACLLILFYLFLYSSFFY